MGFPHSFKPTHEVDQAGGAYVRRRFQMGTSDLLPGEVLDAETVKSIPRANLTALINCGKIELFPAAPGEMGGPISRHMVHIGAGKYVVIEGRQITDDPISKDEAQALIDAPRQTQQ